MQGKQAASRIHDHAIPLVVETEPRSTPRWDAEYTVSKQALNLIAQVEGTLSVVVVCGAYRTGKSYLINRVLLGRSDGFGVGSTIDACTKGLWMWNRLIKCQDHLGNPTNLLIIDSEGLSSCEQDNTADSTLFALSMLLSSLLIYNSMGSIDEDSIGCLAVVSHLTKLLQSEISGNNPDKGCFPDFYWVLRDFSLQLLTKYPKDRYSSGVPITQDEYLENCLKSNKASTDEHNKIRKALTSFFPVRHCYSLVRPTTSQTDLQNLDRIELENLRAEFVEQVLGLRRKILSSLKPKQFNDKKLTGENFCELLASCVTNINRGLLPSIDSTWTHVCRSECQRALSDCTTQFENWIEQILGQLPLSPKDFERAEKEVKRSTLHMFSQQTVGNELAGDHLKELKKVIKSRLELLADQNNKELAKHCKEFIERQFRHVEAKIERGQIRTVAGLIKEVELFGEFLSANYPHKGPSNDRFCSSFLKEQIVKFSLSFSQKLEENIQILNQQIYDQKGQLKGLQTQLNHVKEVEMVQQAQKIVELEASLELERFQSMEFKLSIEALRQEAALCDERTVKLENQRTELKKLLHEFKHKASVADEERYTARQELEIARTELATGRTLNENQMRFYEEMKEEFNLKEKGYQSEIKRLQVELDDKYKELMGKMESTNRRHLQTIQELESRLDSRNSDFARIVEERNEIQNRYLTEISQKNEKIFNLNKELKEGKFKRSCELEESIRGLQKELVVVKKELAQEQQRNRKIKKELDVKSSTTIELEQERNQLKMKLTDKSSRDTLDKSMGNLQEVNSKLESEIRNLKQALEESQSKAAMLTKQYEAELADLNEELEAHEQTKKQLMQQLSQQTRQKDDELIREYEGKLLQLQNQLYRRAQNLTEVKEHERDEYEKGINSLKDVYAKEKEGWEAIQKEEKRRFEIELASLKRTLEEKEKEHTELAATCEEQGEALKEKSQELSRAAEAASYVNTELSQLRQQLTSQQRQLEGLKATQSQSQQLLSEETAKNNELRNRNLIQETKLEEQKAELMRLGKENISLRGKLDALQIELKRKKHADEERELEQEKNELQGRYEQLRIRHQRSCEQFITAKSSLEKDLALSQQNTEFANKKYEDCKAELDKLANSMEQTVRSQRNEALTELKEQLDQKTTELDAIERKHEKLKRSLKDLESSYLRQVSNLENEKNKLQEMLAGSMRRNEQLMAFHEQESIHSNSRMSCLEEKLHLTSDMQGLECERLRKENDELKEELEELQRTNHLLEVRFESEEGLRSTVETLRRQLEELGTERQALIEKHEEVLTAERTEKKQLRHDLSELELKLKAAERGEKRSRLERVSEGVLLEQIELLKNERDEYVANSRRDYHQLNELMTRKLDELEKKVQAEEATNKRLRIELDKETTCFNLSKQNLKDRISQLTLTNDLLAQEVDALKRSTTTAVNSPRNKYRFRLEDLPSG